MYIYFICKTYKIHTYFFTHKMTKSCVLIIFFLKKPLNCNFTARFSLSDNMRCRPPWVGYNCFEAFLKCQGHWNTDSIRPLKSQQGFTNLYDILAFSLFSGTCQFWKIPHLEKLFGMLKSSTEWDWIYAHFKIISWYL